MTDETRARIESEQEIKAYIQNLKYALDNGARLEFQVRRRVELLGEYGETTTFVMSFHFSEKAFTPDMFPYRKE